MSDVATKPVVAVVEPDALSIMAPVKEIPSAEEVAYGIVTVTTGPAEVTDAILRPASLAVSIEAAIAAATVVVFMAAPADAVVNDLWAGPAAAPALAEAVKAAPSSGWKDAVMRSCGIVEAGARTVNVPVGRVPPFQAQRP